MIMAAVVMKKGDLSYIENQGGYQADIVVGANHQVSCRTYFR
jgi:hypothetical protein